MKTFLVKLLVFSAITGILDFAWNELTPPDKHIPHIWLVLAFFAITTGLFHFFAMQSAQGRPQAFIRYYMGSTALRFCLYLAIIAGYRYYDKSTVIPFALGFLGHYFLFAAFEVPVLLRELRNS